MGADNKGGCLSSGGCLVMVGPGKPLFFQVPLLSPLSAARLVFMQLGNALGCLSLCYEGFNRVVL